MKRILIALAATAVAALVVAPVHAQTKQTKAPSPNKSGYVDANGVHYYYEVHGRGEPLPMQAQVGAAMADAMKNTPMYQSYAAIAPKPEDFPKLLDRMGAMMRKPYDWSADVKKLTMPTMLIYGDSDMYRPEHIVKFYKLFGGGLKDAGWMREHMAKNRLAILPDLTHYDIGLAPQLV